MSRLLKHRSFPYVSSTLLATLLSLAATVLVVPVIARHSRRLSNLPPSPTAVVFIVYRRFPQAPIGLAPSYVATLEFLSETSGRAISAASPRSIASPGDLEHNGQKRECHHGRTAD